MTSEKLEQRTCDCGCGRTFTPPSSAPHKRFALASCRQRWHLDRRAEAFAALAAQRAGQDDQTREGDMP